MKKANRKNISRTVIAVTFSLTLLLLSNDGYCQFNNRKKDAIRIGISTGLNSSVGMLGFTAGVPLMKNLSANAGIGKGSWGTKINLGTTYYLDHFAHRWALTAGATHNFANREIKLNVETANNKKEDFVLNCFSQTNVYLAAVKYWNVGKNCNRLHMSLGWSQRLNGQIYNVKSGEALPKTYDKAVRHMAPGGIMMEFGFELGVRKR